MTVASINRFVVDSRSSDASRRATAVVEEEKEERTAFLLSNHTNLQQHEPSTRIHSSSSRRRRLCCRVSCLRGCLFCFLSMLITFSFMVPYAYRYAERLAGDKPLKLRVDVYPDEVADDLSTGKSCTHHRGRWHCRDCSSSTSGGSCRKLKPRGLCPPFRWDDWDKMPRSVSQYDPTNAEEMEFRTLSSTSRYYYHHQPQCTVSSCFDLDKCANNTFTIYVNTTGPHALVDYAVQHLSSRGSGVGVQRVDDYNDACLSVTFPDTYPSLEAMKAAEHWKTTQGRNNLIYDMSNFRFNDTKRLGYDSPLSLFHVGYAAVASVSLTGAIVRTGYDLVLPLRRKWGRPTATVDLHRPRKWLLTFRGTIKDRPQAYYQHRWLAAEYWEEAEDVLVDVRCVHSNLMGAFSRVYKGFHDPSRTVYASLMWNSTFGFAPGGSGVGTYRFGEILSTGGIPVVTHDLVLPLAPEVEWTGCAVRVSEARIVDLPALLRAMSPQEVRRRQVQCWRLLQIVLGDAEDEPGIYTSQYHVTFAKAMEVWMARVANALQMRQQMDWINGGD